MVMEFLSGAGEIQLILVFKISILKGYFDILHDLSFKYENLLKVTCTIKKFHNCPCTNDHLPTLYEGILQLNNQDNSIFNRGYVGT